MAILPLFFVARITIIKYNSEVTKRFNKGEGTMKGLKRMVAVFLAAVMLCLMPVTDMSVMAEEISDTTVTENDSYQIEKSEIEKNVEADSGQDESQIEEVESQEGGIERTAELCRN